MSAMVSEKKMKKEKFRNKVRHTHQLGLKDLIPRPCHTDEVEK